MIICSDADGLRNNDFKILYVLGANMGSFPAPVKSSGIIKDSERRILEENNINFIVPTPKKRLSQNFHFDTAFFFLTKIMNCEL